MKQFLIPQIRHCSLYLLMALIPVICLSENVSYKWSGDTDLFLFGTDGTIQLNAPAASGEATIFFPYTLPAEEEWVITLKTDYKGTSYNLQSVYLCSIPETDTEKDRAIVVTLGGKSGNLTLNRISGTSKKVLIAGRALVKEGGAEVTVKATYSKGIFTLYSKLPSESQYIKEGQAEYERSGKSGHFKLFAKFSKANSTNKYFKNLLIQSLADGQEETEEPEVPIDPDPGKEEGSGGTGDPDTSEVDPPAEGDLLINEIMANSAGLTALPATEYVELYNVTDHDLDLTGCMFRYKEKEYAISLSTMPAESYLVLYKKGKEISIDPEGIDGAMESFPVLVNTGTTLAIIDSDGNEIDEVTYAKATPAVSWERDANGAWALSEDERGGTPGSLNSVYSNESEEGEKEDPDEEEPEEVPSEGTEEPTESEDIKPTEGDLIINEIMANSAGLTALPATEYVELYNVTDHDLDLTGCMFRYKEKEYAMNLSTLPAESYLVLYKKGKEVSIDPEGIDGAMESFPVLVNTGTTLAIIDSDGSEIDEVTYAKATPAVSWERNADGDWALSEDERGGTPGSLNSVYSNESEEGEKENPDEENPDKEADPDEEPNLSDGVDPEVSDVVINEILPAPFDGGSEYIELYNRSEKVISLSNLAITTLRSNGEYGSIYPLKEIEEVLDADDYLLLTKNRNGVEDFYLIKNEGAIHQIKLPVLSNSYSTVILLRTDNETEVDRLSYSHKWHTPELDSEKGVALERINPDKPTDEERNWSSAAEEAGYGTPGYRNSQFLAEDEKGLAIEEPAYDVASDSYSISYHLPGTGFLCRATVYDASGRKRAVILDNQSIASSGTIRWDGHTANGGRLNSGIYILFIECYNAKGQLHRFRKPLLIH